MSKSETKRKPVWRVNTGNGVPSDLGGEVLYMDGLVLVATECTRTEAAMWAIFEGSNASLAAYETTRTREAKYEKVECGYCEGDGVLYHEEESNNNLKCYCCNGKGYRLEAL